MNSRAGNGAWSGCRATLFKVTDNKKHATTCACCPAWSGRLASPPLQSEDGCQSGLPPVCRQGLRSYCHPKASISKCAPCVSHRASSWGHDAYTTFAPPHPRRRAYAGFFTWFVFPLKQTSQAESEGKARQSSELMHGAPACSGVIKYEYTLKSGVRVDRPEPPEAKVATSQQS